MQKVLLELLLLSSTALAVIGDGFIVLPVDKIQTGVGSSNFPNRVPIFDLVEGVSKSFQQDVENINNMIQPIFNDSQLSICAPSMYSKVDPEMLICRYLMTSSEARDSQIESISFSAKA